MCIFDGYLLFPMSGLGSFKSLCKIGFKLGVLILEKFIGPESLFQDGILGSEISL